MGELKPKWSAQSPKSTSEVVLMLVARAASYQDGAETLFISKATGK